jgi:phosphoglycerate dehydrogenase-like enzyme
MQAATKRVLFCVPPKGPAQTESLIGRIPETMAKFVSSYKTVKDMDEYAALSDEDKNVDILVVQLGTTCSGPVLKEQVVNNSNLKWVHSLSAGIDGYVAVQEFRESEIPLTNAKGAFSSILGEFIALGVLYHTKHLERFMQRKAEKKWEIEPMELVSNKSMAIIGYGDIGAACAKIAKLGFGMKVIGVKRNPAACSEEYASYCDEVVGND